MSARSGARGARRSTKPSGPKAHSGRPRLLTPDVQENIVRALRLGNHVKASVEAYGVSYPTAARWIADGTAHAEGTATYAQRENLGAKADEVAEPPCVGTDELDETGEVRRVCSSGLHPYREFREVVVRARAEAQVLLVAKLQSAATAGSTTAILAMLRSLAPEEWGETRKVKVDGTITPTGAPFDIIIVADDRQVAIDVDGYAQPAIIEGSAHDDPVER